MNKTKINLLRFLGLVSLLVGCRWIQLFVFTDYRSAGKPIMIPLGFVAIALGGTILAYSATVNDIEKKEYWEQKLKK